MDKKEFIQAFIPNLDSPEKVYELFQGLGYQEVGARHKVPLLLDPSYKRKKTEFEFAKEEREKVKTIYTVFNWDGKLQIFLIETTTLTSLFLEVGSRTGLGLGLLDLTVYELADCLIINPKLLDEKHIENKKRTVSGLTELGFTPTRPIREQKPNPLSDRKVLDDIVFDILGLTQDERNEVYWAVCELVKNRLDKARSI